MRLKAARRGASLRTPAGNAAASTLSTSWQLHTTADLAPCAPQQQPNAAAAAAGGAEEGAAADGQQGGGAPPKGSEHKQEQASADAGRPGGREGGG